MPVLSNCTLKVGAAAVAAAYFRGVNVTAPPEIDSVVQDRAGAFYGDSMALGQGTTAGNDLTGLLDAEPGWIAYNGGVGGETSTQIKTRFIADTTRQDWTVVFWMGRNNVGQISTILADLAECVAACGHSRYLIISVLPRTDETTGTTPRITVDSLNAQLLAAYPDNFVDLYPTICTAAGDVISTDYLSDALLHLNNAGYALIYPVIKARIDALPSSGIDRTPAAFSFAAANGQTPSSVVESAAVQITGINSATPVSITGGEYRINSGAWTAVAGTLLNGDTLQVRHTAAAGFLGSASCTATVGGVSATFNSLTAATANLVVNGTFDTDTGWTKAAGATIADGKAVFTSANFANVRQNMALVAGKTYRVTYTLSDRSSGSSNIMLFGASQVTGTARSTNGTYTQDLVAPASPTSFRVIGATSNDTFKIDDVSCVQID